MSKTSAPPAFHYPGIILLASRRKRWRATTYQQGRWRDARAGQTRFSAMCSERRLMPPALPYTACATARLHYPHNKLPSRCALRVARRFVCLYAATPPHCISIIFNGAWLLRGLRNTTRGHSFSHTFKLFGSSILSWRRCAATWRLGSVSQDSFLTATCYNLHHPHMTITVGVPYGSAY